MIAGRVARAWRLRSWSPGGSGAPPRSRSAAPGRFPPGVEARLEKFTSLVAVALANAEAREQLTASRARIVQAGDAERRRLERNLHDGAQQRLVTLALVLRLAESRLSDDPAAAAELLARRATSSRSAWRSSVSSLAGSIRRSSPTAASHLRWRRSPRAPRCR